MNLSMLIAVNGTNTGIYRIHGNRTNGLVAEDLATRKRLFIPQRGNDFTPIESISIYREDEMATLKEVFQSMKDKLETLPVPAPKSTEAELRAYFAEILPDYDRDRVYVSDIRKVTKWFTALNNAGVLDQEDPAVTAESDATGDAAE